MSKSARSKKVKSGIKANRLSPAGLKRWWTDQSPVIRFLILFAGVIILFYLFYYSTLYKNHLSGPIENVQARIASAMLNLFSYNTRVSGDVISGSGQSVSISKGCDGLEPMALFVGAILVFPIAFKFKWPGLVAGLIGLFILNNLRIFGLFLAGIHIPEWFDSLHLHGGFVIFTIVSIIIWFIWAGWALKKQRNLVQANT